MCCYGEVDVGGLRAPVANRRCNFANDASILAIRLLSPFLSIREDLIGFWAFEPPSPQRAGALAGTNAPPNLVSFLYPASQRGRKVRTKIKGQREVEDVDEVEGLGYGDGAALLPLTQRTLRHLER